MIRALKNDEETLIWKFLCLAAHDDIETVRENSLLARYAQNWGRESDFGFLYVEEEPIGAIWARIFPENERGFGFISAQTPEIAMAVRPEFRGRGIGRLLLENLIAEAQGRFETLSLNVRADNFAALRLYQNCGFQKIEGSCKVNRTGGVSFNLQRDL